MRKERSIHHATLSIGEVSVVNELLNDFSSLSKTKVEVDVTMSGVNSFIGFVLNLSIIIKNEEFLSSYQLL